MPADARYLLGMSQPRNHYDHDDNNHSTNGCDACFPALKLVQGMQGHSCHSAYDLPPLVFCSPLPPEKSVKDMWTRKK